MEPAPLSPDPPPGQTEVEGLAWLLEQARTFYFSDARVERVSERIAVSHLLTVASHPNPESIHEAALRFAKAYGNDRGYGDWDDDPAYRLLRDLLNLVFAPAANAREHDRQPQMLGVLDGRIRLRRPDVGEHLASLGVWPTFGDLWALWRDNPRRDLTAFLDGIMSPEEIRAEWRTDGAVGPYLSSPAPDTPTVEALLALLRRAAEAYTPGTDACETIGTLLEVARETDTEAIRRAGARLLLSDVDRRRIGAVLAILPPLLFGRRRYGAPIEHPLAPWFPREGRLVLDENLEAGPSPDGWEGEMVVRTRLYERRDLSAFRSPQNV